jgi:radical SAM superfamily enzyme YgiQ (UPF0313 family)
MSHAFFEGGEGRGLAARGMRVVLLDCPAPPGDACVNRSNYCCDYSKADYRKQPIDLVILSGLLAGRHEVSFVDGQARAFSYAGLRAALRARRAECVVLLMGELTRATDVELVRRLRGDAPTALLVGTGDLFRFAPEESRATIPELDAFLLDFTSPSLLRFLEGEADLPNLVSRRDSRPTPRPVREPTFDVAPPLHELFADSSYRPALARHGRVAETLFSFGCPFACRFCVQESIDYVPRTLGSARRELERIVRLGFREVHFCDATFAARRDWAVELFDFMRRAPRLGWWASTRADLLDGDLAERMARAGCHTLTIGVETATDSVNRSLDKRIRREQVRAAVAACKAAGLRTLTHFILGMPGETEGSLRETLEFALELDPFYLSLNVMEAWRCTSFGDDYRARHGEHPKQVAGTTYFYPERDCLPLDTVLACRDEGLRRFYLSPRRWLRYALSIRTPYELQKYLRNGWAITREYVQRRTRAALGGWPGRDARARGRL